MTSSSRSGTGYSKPEWDKWYRTARWKRLRRIQLNKRPYCQCPHHKTQKVPAQVVDHIVPHKGDTKLFWDINNLQSMAKECHDKFKQSQEKGGAGFDLGCDNMGNPLNNQDHWQ